MKQDILRYIELMGRRQKESFAIAREGLLKIGSAAARPLMDVLLKHRNSFIRRHAAMILGELGEKTALKPLMQALNDRMPAVRWNAAIALGLLKDRRAVPMLKRQLKSKIWQLRVNSAISLGWIGDKRALRPLMLLLKDSNRMVRRAAAFALAKFDEPLIKMELMQVLLNKRTPLPEAALGLTFMGELHGYFSMGMLEPSLFWQVPSSGLKRKQQQAIREKIELGHLFARSGLYSQAVIEYRNALSVVHPVSSQTQAALLNNIGCMFRGIGQIEQGYFFFSLAHKLDSQKRQINENLEVSEALLEMREIISERVQYYLKLADKALPIARESFEVLSQVMLPPREHFPYVETSQWPVAYGMLRSFFLLGYRVYHAFLTFRGEEQSRAPQIIPLEFFEEQLQGMEGLFMEEEPFIMYRDLLMVLMDKFRKNFLVQHSRYQKLGELLGHEVIESVFVRGFLVGFLEKIWQSLHQPISLN